MHYLTLFLIAALLTLLPACEKEPLDTLDELVPATQEGANTLGCLIDGEVFYNRGGGFGAQDISATLATIPYERIGVVGKDLSNSDMPKSIRVEIRDIKEGISSHQLSVRAYSEGRGTTRNDYVIDIRQPSNVTVDHLDIIQRIISGTFNFTVVDTLTQDRKVITDGRFDVRYF